MKKTKSFILFECQGVKIKCIVRLDGTIKARGLLVCNSYNAEYQTMYHIANKEVLAERKKIYRLKHRDKYIAYNKQYYIDNKDKCAEYGKQYYIDNKEYVDSRNKKYYNEHKEESREYHREYAKIHVEKICEYMKQYRDNNKSAISLYHKKYYAKNSEKIKQYVREWKLDNTDKVNITNGARRSVSRDWGTPIPINDWFEESNLHHMHLDGDTTFCMYIPVELHQSVWHSHKDDISMEKINTVAWNWYFNVTENRLDEMYENEIDSYRDDFRFGELDEHP